MSLRFVIGRSGSGKTSYCLNELKQLEEGDPQGPPVIYLVPEQMTFQSEYELIHTYRLTGMIRTQVFSMTRLAWRILQETGGMTRYHLTGVGIHVLLRKIIESSKEELGLYKRASEQNGFIEQLEELISELKRYCITPQALYERISQLTQLEERNPNEEVLLQKLRDLQLILQKYDESLMNKYIDGEDYLRLLVDKMEKSTLLKEAEIIVDGFHSFTPQEFLVLEALMKHCKRMTVSLTVDQPYEDNPPSHLHLFHMTGNTYYQLMKIANENGIKVEKQVNLNEDRLPRFENSPALTHLEKNIESRPPVPSEDGKGIKIMSAVNRRAEIEEVARDIIGKVRDHGYRWRDFMLLVRNSEDYETLIETLFDDYGIPVFMDQKQSMLNHPVIELIRSSLDAIQFNWRYEALFRCFKTGLMFPITKDGSNYWDMLNKLENYVLAYGIRGYHWKAQKDWTLRAANDMEGNQRAANDKVKQKEMNALRHLLATPLLTLEANMKAEKTVQERCEVIYTLLEELDIPQKLESLRAEAEAAGELTIAREHEQVWTGVIDLLDQMVELMGEEKVDIDLFAKMLETGLDSLRFSLIPPAIDQVLIGNIDHSRFLHVKCGFILGVNEGVLPARPKENSIITEVERELLRDTGLDMAPGSYQRILDENFTTYVALTSCSDQITISYPMANEEGKALQPSILIKQIKGLFPAIQEQIVFNEPSEEGQEQQLNYITSPKKTLSYLTSQLQLWKKGYAIAPLWWDVYNWFLSNPIGQKDVKLLQGLFYENKAVVLSNESAAQLYGENLQASVSRLEKFQSCSFSHFMSHGLRLKEREIYQLKAPDIGELFHAALKQFAEQLNEKRKKWSDLSTEECEQLTDLIVNELAPKIQREILSSTQRFQYIKKKLQQVITRAVLVLRDHARVSGFSPIGLELGFGRKGDELPPVHYTLKNGKAMDLIGRIDRIDRADGEKGILLRIVDYKSSEKSLGLTEVYFGLSLQMLTYLDVVLTHAREWLGQSALPAGVLYFHVHNPMLNKTGVPSLEKIEEELFKSFKMKGLLLADKEAIQLMDQSLEKGHSQIIPAGLKADGSFYSNSSVVSLDEFTIIQQYVRRLLQSIGTEITNGSVSINPYKLKSHTPCSFCSYKSVCQFDSSLEENEFRLLKQQKSSDILHQMRVEGGENLAYENGEA